MIICICNALNHISIDNAIADGQTRFGGVLRHAGGRPQCGACRGMIESRIEAAHMPPAGELDSEIVTLGAGGLAAET